MDEIGDYMSSPILSIDVESSVQEAAQYMEANHVGSVLVRKYEEYVGLITETDLTRKVLGGKLDPETTLVSDVMTSPILSMDRYLPVDQANEFMHKNKIRHLAITEEDKIVGMLSVKDLVGYYAKSFRMQE
ncbi:MAG: CBS domain-containing protein [Nitrospinaceae bacterium]